MAKEKNYNPVQEAKKTEKQKQLRKQKANLQTQRTEKLARRNPTRIQRDIDALKELDASGSIRAHERQRLQELEKDLAAVNKARAALGDKAPVFKPERRFENHNNNNNNNEDNRSGRSGPNAVLGKRTRDGTRKQDDSSDTDADIQHIPMPRDTPPPIPRRHHYARGDGDGDEDTPTEEPKKPTLVYEAAPQVRDLRKEATKFMPAAVAQKMKLAKGQGRLLEPEEFDQLREEGYMREKKETDKETGADAKESDKVEDDEELEAFLKLQSLSAGELAEQAAEAAVQEAEFGMMAAEAKGQMEGISSEAGIAENKLKHVQMEEVEDEDL
ncbi:hypothetical protein BDW02DRAFT_572999 [Decorospora gaudefroyi]|uniref:Wbp11/ELF5/Saf1 N-terminal domain-containing protein n=1 Tax=Decorospora gaudefroyi TaxID=184978 RepID=A0A6A5K2C2_9PLEO|nr:hypothetical protein BDW02DRAFT_572999 [Decorospora gaudefroyi]